mgnify:CR=1 FL=1
MFIGGARKAFMRISRTPFKTVRALRRLREMRALAKRACAVMALLVLLAGAREADALEIVSDGSWKCGTETTDEWLKPGFDDSAWSDVRAFGIREIFRGHPWAKATHAGLIWSNEDIDRVCVRKRFRLEHVPATATIRILVNDDFLLYVNGTLVARNEDRGFRHDEYAV